jgi:hypothetical protein
MCDCDTNTEAADFPARIRLIQMIGMRGNVNVAVCVWDQYALDPNLVDQTSSSPSLR